MKNKLIIPLGKNKIVAEIDDSNLPEIPPELIVYIVNEQGQISQDICIVRPHYAVNRKTMEFETNNDFVDCLVWGDSDNEDFTDDFCIGVYEEEE